MIGVALFAGYAGRQPESWVGTAARESLFSRAVFQAEAPLATRSLLSRSQVYAKRNWEKLLQIGGSTTH
jgi:hypothetical protein